MVDYGAFGGYVHDALSRLHERRYLEGHPLGQLLAPAGKALDGPALQRALFDAIRELQPQETGAFHATAWRRYRHLVLRHVEAAHPTEVARQLAVSPRQARRDHHEAVELVVAALWARCRATQPDPAQPVGVEDDAALDEELARIGSAPAAGPVHLRDVLAGALDTVTTLAESRAVRIETALAADLHAVAANADVLRQILLSLLTSSIEWDVESRIGLVAENRGAAVEIDLTVERRVRGHHSTREQPFLETDHAPSLRAAGRLAELQGGGIELAETRQGGLAARLRLKAFRPATVLAVDDNPDFVRLFRRYLSGAPYRVIEAKVPGEAIRIAAAAHPDVIMLDVMMPSQDGWQILRELKRRPETSDVPVVVCSVLRERALALSLGAADFLPKPITQAALLACLGQHCGTPSPAPPAASASPRQPTGRLHG